MQMEHVIAQWGHLQSHPLYKVQMTLDINDIVLLMMMVFAVLVKSSVISAS
jgi:hypothetical protein